MTTTTAGGPTKASILRTTRAWRAARAAASKKARTSITVPTWATEAASWDPARAEPTARPTTDKPRAAEIVTTEARRTGGEADLRRPTTRAHTAIAPTASASAHRANVTPASA